MYSSIQKLLVERLPKLSELSFGCLVKYYYSTETEWGARVWIYIWLFDDWIKTIYNWNSEYVRQFEILWHPFTHADILEVLGEDWAMDWAYYLFNHVLKWRPDFPEPILLPRDLHDLSLPEYKDTAERLISLITK